jgi:hypothetical protein
MKPASEGSNHNTTAGPAMVFSHPAAGEDAARASHRSGADDAARNVTFSTQATGNASSAVERGSAPAEPA